MDAQMNGVLAEIRERLSQDWELAEDSEADTQDFDAEVTLEGFFQAMVTSLVEEFDAEEEDAQAAVKQATVKMIRMEALPPLPADDADLEDEQEWVEQAQNIGLFGAALNLFE